MIVQTATRPAGYISWIRDFRGRARAEGISDRTFEAAFSGVSYRQDVIEKDRNQSEFTKQIWEYLDRAVSDKRVANGRDAVRRQRNLLEAIERTYRVEAEVVAAIWGLESSYGDFRGDIPMVDALSTLAYDGRRGRFFEQQLIAVLKIIQAGDVAPRQMTGSWAGAMGHTQFIPTSYLAYAVDFTGDGKRDIWSENPADALASTAAYLKRFGWTYGQPWGMEVALPRGFDYSQTGSRNKKSVGEWSAMGVRQADGSAIPDHGPASILLPAGARGAAFVIFKNFHVIARYNAADAYVIGVGHLSDRIRGGGELRAGWPRGDRGLLFAERREMQQRLTAMGYDTMGADGIIGPNTLRAIKRFQAAQGMVPDGYVSYEILRRLR
nr:lytic murein transglycosylase [Brevirhabdus pacifica]